MTLSELITASRVNGWNVVDEILYQTYLDTLAGSGGISEQILDAIRAYNNDTQPSVLSINNTLTDLYTGAEGKLIALNGLTAYNPNAYPVFIKFFKAVKENVTLGTTIPDYKIMVPALGQVVLDSTSFYTLSDFLCFVCTKFYQTSDTTAITTDVDTYAKITEINQ